MDEESQVPAKEILIKNRVIDWFFRFIAILALPVYYTLTLRYPSIFPDYILYLLFFGLFIFGLYRFVSRANIEASDPIPNEIYLWRSLGAILGLFLGTVMSIILMIATTIVIAPNPQDTWHFGEIIYFMLFAGILIPVLIYIFGTDVADFFYVKKQNSRSR